MTDDGPICACCERGTNEKRLVSVYVRMSEGGGFMPTRLAPVGTTRNRRLLIRCSIAGAISQR